MSIDRPRRIFRSSSRVPAWIATVLSIGVCATALLVGGLVVAADVPAQVAASRGHDWQVISARAEQVAVIDGETLRVGAVVIRLIDVAAPARGQACAAGPDCGGRAAAALADLVRDQTVECHVMGRDGMGRPAGRCDAGGQDVNAALVAAGWARSQTAAFSAAERDARTQRRGIWLAN